MKFVTSFPLARQADPRKWWMFGGIVALAAIPIWITTGILARQPGFAAGIIASLCGLLLVAFVACDRSKSVRFEVADGILRIRGDFFGCEIAVQTLRLNAAEIVDLTTRPELRPGWIKNCGTALPGYWSGDIPLRNGQAALVFLSDLRRVLVIPEKSGRLLLLSCAESDGLLRALRDAANPAATAWE